MHTYIRVCVCACARIYTCTIHLHSPSRHAQTGAGRASPRAALIRSHRHALSHPRVPCTRDDKASYVTLQLSSDECSSLPAQQGGQGRAGPPLSCGGCVVSLQEKMSSVHSAWRCGRPGRGAGRSPGGGRTTEDEKSGRKGGARADSHTDAERARFRSGFFRSRRFRRRGVGAGGGAGCYFFLAWSISMRSVCDGALPLMCL